MRFFSRVLALAVASLGLVVLPLACKEAQEAVRPDAQGIPAPDAQGHPKDNPPAAERAALGSNSPGRGPAPRTPSAPDLQATEDQKLAVNASLDTAKKGVQERADAVHGGQAHAGEAAPPAVRGVVSPVGASLGTEVGAATSGAQAALRASVGTAPELTSLPLAGQDVERATLVFSASTAGQLVPCGCSPDMRGGLPRAAALLSQWRLEDPRLVYIEAGDLLFAADKAPTGALAAQAELKAKTLSQAVALMSPAARVVGKRDLALGKALVAATTGKAPLLDAGVDVAGAQETLLVKAGKSMIPVGVFAAGLHAPEVAVPARAAALRAQGARLLVLIAHPGGEPAPLAALALLQLARASGVDLVVLGHRDDPATDPDSADVGEPPFLRVEGHGQSLLRVDLAFPKTPAQPGPRVPLFLIKSLSGKLDDANALGLRIGMLKDRLATTPDALKPSLLSKLQDLEDRQQQALTAPEHVPEGAPVATARFFKLDSLLPDDPKVAQLVAAYDAQVEAQNLALAKTQPADCPKPKKGEAFLVGVSDRLPVRHEEGARSCASCHETEARFWTRTPHARAYDSLVAVKKQFSLDCIPCHVTGWQQPGGVCRIDQVLSGGPGLTSQGAPSDSLIPVAAQLPVTPERFGQGRAGVQCEMCHEAASAHAIRSAKKSSRVPATTCRRCHEAENSPLFDYDKYLPWIIGPGHGRKLSKGEEPRNLGELAQGHPGGPNSALRESLKAKDLPVETRP